MITAVDTNVLLDILIPGARHGDDSERALAQALRVGAVVVSEPVYAELALTSLTAVTRTTSWRPPAGG